MKFFIKTFGCQQNKADSERIAASYKGRGMIAAKNYVDADIVIINTCMVRKSAEDRVYGLIQNLEKIKKEREQKGNGLKIIVTGCMVGIAYRDKTGKYLARIREKLPAVDEFMPIEEVGFDMLPIRQDAVNAWVPISNGCNNFCTFCIVPFTRGREISRPYEDILRECFTLKQKGYKIVTLLGQNVNSYGSDLILGEKNIQVMRDIETTYFKHDTSGRDIEQFEVLGKKIKPVYVKHLGRMRIPTLFPHLLEDIAKMGFEKVDFFSANPWDYSDELIEVIARNKNITRTLHLPIQSGSSSMLRRMNRWYSKEEYLSLIQHIRSIIPEIKFTTDIIVGFCGETEEEFGETIELCKKVGFSAAYIGRYSPRPMTAATKTLVDDIPAAVKKKRWEYLDEMVNKSNLRDGTYSLQYVPTSE